MLDYSWTEVDSVTRAAGDSLAALARIGGKFGSVPPFNDEPKVISLTALFPGELEAEGLGRASGSAWDPDRAAAKLLGEAAERLSAVPTDEVRSRPPRAFAALTESALNPELIPFECRGVQPDPSHEVRWLPGLKAEAGGTVESLIPAKLVFLPYELPDEPIWSLSNSNGLAAGSCLEHAVLSALLEILERQALMYFWDNPESALCVASSEVELLAGSLPGLLRLVDRYSLLPTFLELSSPVSSIVVSLCHLADQTERGAHSSIGLKASTDRRRAHVGALEEAIQLRPWLREVAVSGASVPETLRTIDDRAVWWLSPAGQREWGRRRSLVREQGIEHLYLNGRPATLGMVIGQVRQAVGDVWVVPLPSVADELSVARVVVPSIAPIYFDEEYPINPTREGAYAVRTRHPLL